MDASPLAKLPAELRELIYIFAMGDMETKSLTIDHDDPSEARVVIECGHPSVTAVCKQIRNESHPLFRAHVPPRINIELSGSHDNTKLSEALDSTISALEAQWQKEVPLSGRLGIDIHWNTFQLTAEHALVFVKQVKRILARHQLKPGFRLRSRHYEHPQLGKEYSPYYDLNCATAGEMAAVLNATIMYCGDFFKTMVWSEEERALWGWNDDRSIEQFRFHRLITEDEEWGLGKDREWIPIYQAITAVRVRHEEG